MRDQKQPVDIAIEGEKISAVGPKLPGRGQKEIDAAGNLVLPGFFNLHYHADKCLLGEVMRPNVSGTLPEAIEITNDFKRNYDPAEVAARAVRTIETGSRTARRSSGCSATLARSAGFRPRAVCCSRARR